MAALKRLEFSNFQSLKDTSLSLDPGFNVVVGPSNLGKSAAIRALKLLIRNAAAPGLIREGAKEMHLTASFEDGDCIEAIKGKNKSEFYFNGEVFAKAGANDVPLIVEQTWNIPNPDGRELCFASQHEPPFLLAEPASAVAKVLGDLTNASLLMNAVGNINKVRTQANSDFTARSREAEEAKDELLTHTGYSVRLKAIETAREAYEGACRFISELDDLESFKTEYELLSAESKELELAAAISDKVASALEDLQLEQEWRVTVNAVLEAATTVAELNQQVVELQNTIHEKLHEAGTCPMCGQAVK